MEYNCESLTGSSGSFKKNPQYRDDNLHGKNIFTIGCSIFSSLTLESMSKNDLLLVQCPQNS